MIPKAGFTEMEIVFCARSILSMCRQPWHGFGRHLPSAGLSNAVWCQQQFSPLNLGSLLYLSMSVSSFPPILGSGRQASGWMPPR